MKKQQKITRFWTILTITYGQKNITALLKPKHNGVLNMTKTSQFYKHVITLKLETWH